MDSRTAIGRAARIAARMAARGVVAVQQRAAARAATGSGDEPSAGDRVEPLGEEEVRRRREEILRRAPIPTFWTFGKTGSGKSSIVRFLTGADAAEVGDGFRPCTLRSHRYDFPDAELPAMRFLDTRGLGEVSYDPTEDIAAFDAEAHAMIVVARAMDSAQSDVVEPLRRIRRARPTRPVVLALTSLHEATGGAEHPHPDPWIHAPTAAEAFVVPEAVDPRLAEAVRRQVARFHGLVDHVVPIDLTPEHEGFEEPSFGGRRLQAALARTLPETCRQSFRQFAEGRRAVRSLNERRAMPHVMAGASAAAGAAAVPLPWVDIPLVLAIQGRMLARIAAIHGHRLDPRTAVEIMGGLAGRLAVRLAMRGLIKAVPLVGAAANAAVTWAWTYGLGLTAIWYYGEQRAGNEPTAQEIERVWGDRMREALARWQRGGEGADGGGTAAGAATAGASGVPGASGEPSAATPGGAAPDPAPAPAPAPAPDPESRP